MKNRREKKKRILKYKSTREKTRKNSKGGKIIDVGETRARRMGQRKEKEWQRVKKGTKKKRTLQHNDVFNSIKIFSFHFN